MRHRIKKSKVKKGGSTSGVYLSKLAGNFIRDGKLRSTLNRAKAVKSLIDELSYRATNKSEASKNVLLRRLRSKTAVEKLITTVGSKGVGQTGGFVRLIRVGTRLADGSEMARVEWTELFKAHELKKVASKDKSVKEEIKTNG